ncbi:VanZ family protein [Corynebacterium heidelbergense]|uniref:VanZ-like domain-containing protein n=1 Tax=Corynebacterium heidelbergense TaxID=2055947 RepID=A0A364VAD9_9CORY|nr:VanZ family protein [Corynebacterium heidelbergense]RAV33630.1 hypothetical protein CWC39_07450 [Corynebacterium heidelbergense]WCZ36847.1 VanZ like family protein [Corynebacterium heidelbergense]
MPRLRPSTPVSALAFVVYATVMVALTMLKAFYRIGYLWDPARQHQRGLSLAVLREIREGSSWFAPLFGYVGNVGFFVPFGVLLFVFIYRRHLAQRSSDQPRPWRWVLAVTLLSAAASVAMETAQYVFSLGFSDIDDVLMNTLGGLLGAVIAKTFGPRAHWVWVYGALAIGVVFAVLVGLGERLGDPSKIREV